ncbi:MAG: hypothetical protein ABSB40_07960 [Nitrososphaeria archaeon]
MSSLLNKLIDIEVRAGNFYANSRIGTGGELSNYFQIFSKEHQDTATKIETTKRETIVEFTLEPISGMEIEKFLKRIDDTTLNRQITAIDKATIIEEQISQLYTDVAGKISHISGEANQILLNSNKKAKKRLDILKSLAKGQ